jgi:uncharacterized repeat protein (TIGR03803 family)
MADPKQRRGWISGVGMKAESAALMLAVVLVLGVVTIPSAQAQTFTLLYNFTDGPDGAYPYAGLVRDAAGNLYGTTYYCNCNSSYYGVVFKVDTSGTEIVLYSFAGSSDGAYPYAGLVLDSAGNLYGTTEVGGASGNGTVFKVDTSGSETVLHSFAGGTTDGCNPVGGLLRDKAGNLYGTTEDCGAHGKGTVFEVDTSGTETVLHSFAGGSSDGAYPLYTSLVMDKNGNFYGVTEEGGTSSSGVVYELTKGGALTVLHSFAGGKDGCYVLGTPALDKAGNLYGATEGCGSSQMGIAWKVSKKGTETVLHNFAGGSSDGEYPWAGVILDARGNLYGVTVLGGPNSGGTVYELNKKGTLTVLHSFSYNEDGAFPIGGLIRDAKGNFYGTASVGGKWTVGTVWKLAP